jgi:hypothetical protein
MIEIRPIEPSFCGFATSFDGDILPFGTVPAGFELRRSYEVPAPILASP